MISSDREYMLEEERLMIRDSGEIPEIALHSSLFFLCEDVEGPHLLLTAEELSGLQEAVLERYQTIILRDLSPENRAQSVFRGIDRARCNWHRFVRFCERIGVSSVSFQSKVAQALVAYLLQEEEDLQYHNRVLSINCSRDDLSAFLQEVGLGSLPIPPCVSHHLERS